MSKFRPLAILDHESAAITYEVSLHVPTCLAQLVSDYVNLRSAYQTFLKLLDNDDGFETTLYDRSAQTMGTWDCLYYLGDSITFRFMAQDFDLEFYRNYYFQLKDPHIWDFFIGGPLPQLADFLKECKTYCITNGFFVDHYFIAAIDDESYRMEDGVVSNQTCSEWITAEVRRALTNRLIEFEHPTMWA
jgi:hypothetical protein